MSNFFASVVKMCVILLIVGGLIWFGLALVSSLEALSTVIDQHHEVVPQ